MRPVLVVPGQPSREICGPAGGRGERDGIGPFPEHGLNEALCLAVRLRGVGSGADVPDGEHPQRFAEEPGDVSRAVVGHHSLHADAPLLEPAQRPHEEPGGRPPPLVGQHLDIGKPGRIVDGDMQEVVAKPLAGATPVAGDAVADAFKAGQPLDVEMKQLAGTLALIAPHRLLRIKRGQPAETHPRQPAGNRRSRQSEAGRNLLTRQPILAAQLGRQPGPERARRRSARMGPGRAVLQPGFSIAPPSRQPFAGGSFADPEAGRHFADRPALSYDPPDHLRSTKRCRSRILVRVVHPRALRCFVSQRPPSGSHGR